MFKSENEKVGERMPVEFRNEKCRCRRAAKEKGTGRKQEEVKMSQAFETRLGDERKKEKWRGEVMCI